MHLHTEVFTHRSFYTKKHLHTASFHTEPAFTQSKGSFYSQKVFYTEHFFTQRSIYTQKLLHTASFYTDTFTHSKLSHKEVLHRKDVALKSIYRNCSSKTGWISTPKQKKTILKHFVQQNKKENHQRQN